MGKLRIVWFPVWFTVLWWKAPSVWPVDVTMVNVPNDVLTLTKHRTPDPGNCGPCAGCPVSSLAFPFSETRKWINWISLPSWGAHSWFPAGPRLHNGQHRDTAARTQNTITHKWGDMHPTPHTGYWTVLCTFRIQEHGRQKTGRVRRAAAACLRGAATRRIFNFSCFNPFCFYSRRRSAWTFVLRSVVMALIARYWVVTGDWGSLPR